MFKKPAITVEAQPIATKEELHKNFSDQHNEIIRWREAKLAKPDLPNEMTFDNIIPAPDDPDLWPLQREWLTLWRIGSLFNHRISMCC